MVVSLIRQARRAAGLSQDALAVRSATSRTALSAYERGRKSPSLATFERIVRATGFDLAITPTIVYQEVVADRGRPFFVPNSLPRLPVQQAFATCVLPLHLNWSDPGRSFNLRVRRERARVYEIVLREGGPDDIARYIDGALLIDLWDELVLPAAVRVGWANVITAAIEPRVDVTGSPEPTAA